MNSRRGFLKALVAMPVAVVCPKPEPVVPAGTVPRNHRISAQWRMVNAGVSEDRWKYAQFYLGDKP